MLTQATSRTDFEDIMLREARHEGTNPYSTSMSGLEQANLETDGRIVVGQGPGENGNKELVFNGHRVSLQEEEKVLETEDGDVCTTK